MANDEAEPMTERVSLTTDRVDAGYYARVTYENPDDEPRLHGFGLSAAEPVSDHDGKPYTHAAASPYVDAATRRAADRYPDATDGDVVAFLLIDTDADEALFVGRHDRVAFDDDSDTADANGDLTYGRVSMFGRHTVRVAGVGCVDIDPWEVAEVVEPYDGDD